MTNAVVEYVSYRDHERARAARKASQVLCERYANIFKAVTRANLVRYNVVEIEYATVAEMTFGLEIGGLKVNASRSRPSPAQIQATGIPRELLPPHEDASISLDG